LLFIDILRIVGITLVLLEHVAGSGIYPWFLDYYLNINIFNIYIVCFGTVGVSLFLVASGCSLALGCKRVDTKEKIKEFYGKRVLRIYPAYWTAILFAVMMDSSILQKQFFAIDYVKLISGFQSIGATTLGDFYGKVNGNFWFITIILSMYLLFPIIFFAIKKHPHISIVSLFAISALSRYYFSQLPMFFKGIDWFPLCTVFEFGLGIYLIKTGFYPRTFSKSLFVFLSNISFYVYLINAKLTNLLYYPAIFAATLLVIGTIMYELDIAVKRAIISGLKYFRSG
jgi:peptidoglycan/LPS O-acetylase OafA/YrhL